MTSRIIGYTARSFPRTAISGPVRGCCPQQVPHCNHRAVSDFFMPLHSGNARYLSPEKQKQVLVYDEIERLTGIPRSSIYGIRYSKKAPILSANCFWLWWMAKNAARKAKLLTSEEIRRRRTALSARRRATATPDRLDAMRAVQRASYARRIERERERAKAKMKAMRATASGKIQQALRRKLYGLVRDGALRKTKSALALAGCSLKELRQHIEAKFLPGMAWNNYGRWHIDHIRPCASFELSEPSQQRECFHFSNLQPLWARQNLSKCSRWNGAKWSKAVPV